jgi:CO/xanthine dehydrogenase Mo-binding subunit
MGVALVECYETYFCLIADVSVNKGELKLNRLVSAVDCGTLINANIADQQMESGLVSGMQSIWLEITIKDGRVQQRNFDTYPLPRMVQMPKFETYFVPSNEKPGGLGEVGTPLVAPAVCNAIFAVTGKRVRKLPIKASDLA